MRFSPLLSITVLLSMAALLHAGDDPPDLLEGLTRDLELRRRATGGLLPEQADEPSRDADVETPPPDEVPPENPLADDPAIRRLMEEVIFQQRIENFAEVIRLLHRILELSPDEPATMLQLGTTYAQAGEPRKAIETLQALLERDPYHYAVLNNLAYVYATTPDLQVRDGHKAMTLARRALVSAPGDHHVWNTLSESYFIQEEYDKAAAAAEMALRLARAAGLQGSPLNRIGEQLDKCRQAALTKRLLTP